MSNDLVIGCAPNSRYKQNGLPPLGLSKRKDKSIFYTNDKEKK
jgi:hypothetical protein